MDPTSVTSVFNLPAPSMRGFAVLPFHPLALVAARDDTPKLIVSYDHNAQDRLRHKGVARVTSDCTHVNVTVVPGSGAFPVCSAFAAASHAVTMRENGFDWVNPELRAEDDALFATLKNWPGATKLAHPAIWKCLPGQIVDESWRLADSFMSVTLRNDRQIAGAIEKISEWRQNPPVYQVAGFTGRNCKSHVNDVIRAAGLRNPMAWNVRPWPGIDILAINAYCRGALRSAGDWLLQPRDVTQVLARQAAKEIALSRASGLKSMLSPAARESLPLSVLAPAA